MIKAWRMAKLQKCLYFFHKDINLSLNKFWNPTWQKSHDTTKTREHHFPAGDDNNKNRGKKCFKNKGGDQNGCHHELF